MTIAPESQTTTVFGKSVSAIQSADTAITNNVVSGTLPYIAHWTGYSPSDDEMASGNYLALKFTKASNVTKVTVQMIPGNKPALELDEDMNAVFRIADTSQVIEVKAYTDTELVQETTLALTDLTLEEDDS